VIPWPYFKGGVLFDRSCSHAFGWLHSTATSPMRALQPVQEISRSAAKVQNRGFSRERDPARKPIDDPVGVCPGVIVRPTCVVIIDHSLSIEGTRPSQRRRVPQNTA
jgi:hypothetical protein